MASENSADVALGEVFFGEYIELPLMIGNDAKETVRIQTIRPSCSCFSVEFSREDIPVGADIEFRVSTFAFFTGKNRYDFEVYTDRNSRPETISLTFTVNSTLALEPPRLHYVSKDFANGAVTTDINYGKLTRGDDQIHLRVKEPKLPPVQVENGSGPRSISLTITVPRTLPYSENILVSLISPKDRARIIALPLTIEKY